MSKNMYHTLKNQENLTEKGGNSSLLSGMRMVEARHIVGKVGNVAFYIRI